MKNRHFQNERSLIYSSTVCLTFGFLSTFPPSSVFSFRKATVEVIYKRMYYFQPSNIRQKWGWFWQFNARRPTPFRITCETIDTLKKLVVMFCTKKKRWIERITKAEVASNSHLAWIWLSETGYQGSGLESDGYPIEFAGDAFDGGIQETDIKSGVYCSIWS